MNEVSAGIPLLHIADSALEALPAEAGKVAILATGPTHKAGFYQQRTRDSGREVIDSQELRSTTTLLIEEGKLLSFNASLNEDTKTLRNARGYVMGHAGEVENRHGLHALAALQAFGRIAGLSFDTERLKHAMLDYNRRVGVAFCALQNVLTH